VALDKYLLFVIGKLIHETSMLVGLESPRIVHWRGFAEKRRGTNEIGYCTPWPKLFQMKFRYACEGRPLVMQYATMGEELKEEVLFVKRARVPHSGPRRWPSRSGKQR
jgi:hypothetical protein